MKLLDITIYYHQKSGGIKKYIDKKIEFFNNHLVVNHILVIPGKKNCVYFRGNTKVYEVASFPIPMSGGYRFFANIKNINQIISRENPHIIEFGGCYSLYPLIKKSPFSIYTIFYHSDLLNDVKLYPGPQKIKKFFVQYIIDNVLLQADLILSPSDRYFSILQEMGVNSLVPIYLGVDSKVFCPAYRETDFWRRYNVNDKKIKLLYVGRLSIDKNITLLIDLLKFLDPEKYQLIIVGSGPLAPFVKIKEKKIKNLTYLGHIQDESILGKIYANADIFVSTSFYETFGLTFVEAQSSGLPVVSFDLKINTQLIKDFLVKDFDLKLLAQKVNYVAQNFLGPKFRNMLHIQASKNFSWEKTFCKLVNIYRDLVRNRFLVSPFSFSSSPFFSFKNSSPFL